MNLLFNSVHELVDKMVFHQIVGEKKRALTVYLHGERSYSCRKIAAKLQISKSSVSRILNEETRTRSESKKCKIRGRPFLLTSRDQRKLSRSISELRLANPNFTCMDIVRNSGIDITRAKYRTFVSYLNRLGYKFRQTRKKGLLSQNDYNARLKYARAASKLDPSYWMKDIAFYLDGVSFIHKNNPLKDAISPRSRIWRKSGEGLSLTAKGSKDLAGGKRVHVMVAIAPRKGVILAEVYEKMSASYFSDLVNRKFLTLFRLAGKTCRCEKTFVMDNDPSQTSGKAMETLRQLGITLKRIPPRSPDLNPIENFFNVVKRKLREDAIKKSIKKETWDEFANRVRSTIFSISNSYIDKTIKSMPKRIKQIICSKGRRIKY